jgi:hypothetical protein
MSDETPINNVQFVLTTYDLLQSSIEELVASKL